MRRLLLIISFVFSFYVGHSQEMISVYHSSYFDEIYDILVVNDGDLRLYIQVSGERKPDRVMFLISGEQKIREFSKTLETAKEKFMDWSRVAEENNVKNFDKRIDVVFPNITVCWYGLEWWFDFFERPNPRFIVSDSGECVFVMTGTATASSNEYIDQAYSFVLSSEIEFEELLRNIQIENLMDYLNKQKNIDTLFK